MGTPRRFDPAVSPFILLYRDENEPFNIVLFEDITDLMRFVGKKKLTLDRYIIVHGELVKGTDFCKLPIGGHLPELDEYEADSILAGEAYPPDVIQALIERNQ